jgi:flagellin-like protein
VYNLNKKGLSEIIGNVLLILIAVASIALVFGIFTNLTTQLSPAFSCIDAQLSPLVQVSKACLNADGKIEATISRNSDTEFSEMVFSSVSEASSISYSCGETCSACTILNPYETKTYYLDSTTLTSPQTLTLSVNDCLMQTVKIQPFCL